MSNIKTKNVRLSFAYCNIGTDMFLSSQWQGCFTCDVVIVDNNVESDRSVDVDPWRSNVV